MIEPTLPDNDEMYRAVVERDGHYDGVFIVAVKTTGIFCRTSCPAKKPRRENVEFFRTTREALLAGYRACLRCRPLELRGEPPAWLRDLLVAVDEDRLRRWRDQDLHERGLDPTRVRRWFQREHGMSFHAYLRAQRLGLALGKMRRGEDLTLTAYDHGYQSLSGFRDAFQRVFGDTPGRTRGTRQLFVTRLPTPLGPMVAGATDTAVCLLEFADGPLLEQQLERLTRGLDACFSPGSNDVLARLEAELRLYFEGRLREFSVPLVLNGTEFQREVWEALRTIPYGETRSYGDQARLMGRPKSVRAVARANGDNRISIVIPCHRVVGSNGTLTGYGGGLWRKRALLDHEREQQATGVTPGTPAARVGGVRGGSAPERPTSPPGPDS